MSAATTGLQATSPQRGGDAAVMANVRCALAFLAVLALAWTGVGAGLVRFLFPLAVFAASGLLILRDRPGGYLTLLVWTFTVTPLVRRLVDHHAGWLDANPVMLAPYLASTMALLAIPRLLAGAAIPGRSRIVAILVVVFYGLMLAMLDGRTVSGVFDALRWAMPPLIGATIVLATCRGLAYRRYLEAYFVLALIGCSLYGIWQFLVAPPWDALWIAQSGMESIGRPAPFEIRVFSTWNSPGSFSFFLLSGILVLMGGRARWREVAIVLAIAALALTLIRSTWIALLLGMVLAAAFGGRSARLMPLAVAATVALALPLLSLDPRIGELLAERARSLTQLGSDVSAYDRLDAYAGLARELDEHPLGQGLGIAGKYAEVDGGEARIIDGGLIEVPVAVGIFGGALYLLAVASLGAQGFARAVRRADLAGYGALIASYGLLFLSGTTTIGEIGLFFWIALAIVLSADGAPSTLYETVNGSRRNRSPRLNVSGHAVRTR